MNKYNFIIKRVRKDLELLYQLEAQNKVNFDIIYPKIREKHEYRMLDFQAIWIDFRNEKARGAV